MLGTVLLLLALAKPAYPSPAGVASRRAEALKKLLEVFGMEDPPAPPAHFKKPPQYMVDLFNTVANADGVTKNPDILEGNTARSFLDRTHSEEMRFLFVLSSVAKNEKILTAELHLFRLWPRVTDGPKRHHFCQVSVYQVLEKEKPDTPGGKKLLAARLVSLQTSGWEVFAITPAFATGRDQHESKKPLLVLFTDDGRRGASLPTGSFQAKVPVPKPVGSRSTRSLDRLQPCQRHPLSVDFEEIGWSGWIISPRGYNAFHCKGSCPFPLGENMRPTNHATVQSIINALKLSEGVSTPCCVPDKLYSINLLYFDDDENVVLKQYDDMVAGSCGCH
ncbi:bone morphogenetic protein 2-like protein [Pitangus sulphuratus]|nr:bone morphogenetic protein 2-like protein [Pitangus sulphuratus]